MIERSIFTPEHEMWRESVRRFVEQEIVPFHAAWEHDGIVPRELWLKAGEAGMLCCTVPEEYGGLGLDYLFDVIVYEELWKVGASGPGFLIHTDLVATYILTAGTEEQKRQWLPKMVMDRHNPFVLCLSRCNHRQPSRRAALLQLLHDRAQPIG